MTRRLLFTFVTFVFCVVNKDPWWAFLTFCAYQLLWELAVWNDLSLEDVRRAKRKPVVY